MAYKHRTATSVTIFLTIAMTLTQSLGFVVEDVLPPDADSYPGYSYNLDDIYAPGDEHAFAGPIASIMKLNEHLVQNRDTTLRDLVPDDFADLFRLLMSGELLANEDFLVQLGDKLAVELEGRLGHDLLIDAVGRIYEINPEEQDDVIQQTTDEPPAGESGVSEDCRRDFARLLEPITNKIAYQVTASCLLSFQYKIYMQLHFFNLVASALLFPLPHPLLSLSISLSLSLSLSLSHSRSFIPALMFISAHISLVCLYFFPSFPSSLILPFSLTYVTL